ncbi:hypothetical protein EW145_g4128 [Phellinidium pouzarii]|uniref:RRM domain-containing protein n=1 Tax=Phellinidium pouzarii TaxID=167371 RepID=A0A4S4L9R4_9AGAM|nr:hypothetical protein EW145_g4128 [Phellinidium pouzarii]
MEPVTKRLHVSGLTSQISSADLTARFSSFGKVTALDGRGKVDALGQPRPFAYVTLETTKGQLSKCLNLLSGTTWKGSHLRIGEAKADFIERIHKENEPNLSEADSTRPKKRQRIARSYVSAQSADMTPVTPATAVKRSGWRITPLGRLVRPMRMRPLRPLPHPPAFSMSSSTAPTHRKGKKKVRPPLVRARRRLLDPEAWGSEYLKGVMLESTSKIILPEKPLGARPILGADEVSGNNETLPTPAPTASTLAPESPWPSPLPSPLLPPIIVTQVPETRAHPPLTEYSKSDFAHEAAQSLALLNSLFGQSGDNDGRDEDEDEWGGAESLSDIEFDLPAQTSAGVSNGGADDGIEYVPRDVPASSTKKAKAKRPLVENEDQGTEIDEEHEAGPSNRRGHSKSITTSGSESEAKGNFSPKVNLPTLKDMFAPRAEDVGFSILGNLELDLELEDALGVSAPFAPATHIGSSTTPIVSLPNEHASFAPTFDASKPFFFPSSFSASRTMHSGGRRPPDILDLLRVRASGFHRTESADAIRARWTERKVELTRDWKRRHREAVKSVRRRGGGLN